MLYLALILAATALASNFDEYQDPEPIVVQPNRMPVQQIPVQVPVQQPVAPLPPAPTPIPLGDLQVIPQAPPGVRVNKLCDGYSCIFSLKNFEPDFPAHSGSAFAFCVFPSPPPRSETFPVHRYWLSRAGGRIDHLITHNAGDIGTATPKVSGAHGYTYIENLGFVYQNDNFNMHLRPIYRFWNTRLLVHFYSININEFGKLNQGNKADPWVLEGMIGFTTLNC